MDEKYHIKRQHEVAESPSLHEVMDHGVEMNTIRRDRAMRDVRHPR